MYSCGLHTPSSFSYNLNLVYIRSNVISYIQSNFKKTTHDWVLSLPSLKKAIASSSLSRARGAASVMWIIRDTVPARPKNRYMVVCCQFITSSQCCSVELYSWSLGPSAANCSASIPEEHHRVHTEICDLRVNTDICLFHSLTTQSGLLEFMLPCVLD